MIGTDIIEIERVRKSAENSAFLKGVFTDNERDYYAAHGSKAETLAGMFCAKEAISKALGTGFRGFKPCDVEILHKETGAPYVNFTDKAKEKFSDVKVEISISHCKDYATAVAIAFSGNCG